MRKTFVLPHVLEVSRVADLDADGLADVVWTVHSPRDIATGQASGLIVSHGNGQGDFEPRRTFVIPHVLDVHVADFDGDGSVDLAVRTAREAGSGLATGRRAPAVTVLANDGKGGFTQGKPVDLPDDFPDVAPIAADVNGDGRADLVAYRQRRAAPRAGTWSWRPSPSTSRASTSRRPGSPSRSRASSPPPARWPPAT